MWANQDLGTYDPNAPTPVQPVNLKSYFVEPPKDFAPLAGGPGYGDVELSDSTFHPTPDPNEYLMQFADGPDGGSSAAMLKGFLDIFFEDIPTVYRNSRAAGYGRFDAGYNAIGTALGTVTGVRGVSDGFSEHDAVDAHRQSATERVFDGVTGTIALAATAYGTAGALKSLGSGAAIAEEAVAVRSSPVKPRVGEPPAPRPSVNTSLSSRVTEELPAGELRTPQEVAKARNFFERNRQAAREWWSKRNGGKLWPEDAVHDSHPRPLKDGGDPLYIEPSFNSPNAEHMIPGPDGLTDFQRWGRLGGRPPKQ